MSLHESLTSSLCEDYIAKSRLNLVMSRPNGRQTCKQFVTHNRKHKMRQCGLMVAHHYLKQSR